MTAVVLNEAKLTNLMIALSDHYSSAIPRPQGKIIQFTMVDENTSYQSATKKITQILASEGCGTAQVSVTPGPEIRRSNRRIVVRIDRDFLLPDFRL